VLLGFCVANKDRESFDFDDAFPFWSHFFCFYFYFVFIPNFKWVINFFTAFVFCISWSSFLGLKGHLPCFRNYSTLSLYSRAQEFCFDLLKKLKKAGFFVSLIKNLEVNQAAY